MVIGMYLDVIDWLEERERRLKERSDVLSSRIQKRLKLTEASLEKAYKHLESSGWGCDGEDDDSSSSSSDDDSLVGN